VEEHNFSNSLAGKHHQQKWIFFSFSEADLLLATYNLCAIITWILGF
jgi:hypothetical protein